MLRSLNAWNPQLKLASYRGELLVKITDMKTSEQRAHWWSGGRRQQQCGARDLCSGAVKMARLASAASEGEDGDRFLERSDAVSVTRRYANWLHTDKKKEKRTNMSTVRCFSAGGTTGYVK